MENGKWKVESGKWKIEEGTESNMASVGHRSNLVRTLENGKWKFLLKVVQRVHDHKTTLKASTNHSNFAANPCRKVKVCRHPGLRPFVLSDVQLTWTNI